MRSRPLKPLEWLHPAAITSSRVTKEEYDGLAPHTARVVLGTGPRGQPDGDCRASAPRSRPGKAICGRKDSAYFRGLCYLVGEVAEASELWFAISDLGGGFRHGLL